MQTGFFNSIGMLAILGFVPLAVALWAIVRGHRAVIVITALGTLFLPSVTYHLAGFLDYTQGTATSLGLLAGVLLMEPQRLLSLRPRWFDLPLAVYCLVPVASSLSNGLGLYDGVSATVVQVLTTGVPYLIGRAYFTELSHGRDLAMGVLLAGLIYLPLCLWEIQMSPQLHYQLYGIRQHMFGQAHRFGGWRPMVFMQHGLAVSMLMASAFLCAFWLYRSKCFRGLGPLPAWPIVLALLVVAVLCKSALSVLLLLAGMTALYLSARLQTRLLLASLILVAPLYGALRGTGTWSGQELLTVGAMISPDRAESIQTRLESEAVLLAHAQERPWLGWGGWGRHLVYRPDGKRAAIPDGQWVAAIGRHGRIGVAAGMLVFILPALLLLHRYPPRLWQQPAVAPIAVLALLALLHGIDNLLNNMPNPLFLLAAGCVASVCANATTRQDAPFPSRATTGHKPALAGPPAPAPLRGSLSSAHRTGRLGQSRNRSAKTMAALRLPRLKRRTLPLDSRSGSTPPPAPLFAPHAPPGLRSALFSLPRSPRLNRRLRP